MDSPRSREGGRDSPKLSEVARSPQLVARSPQRLQRKRIAELCTQPADVDVDGARAPLVAAAPDAREERFTRENTASVGGKKPKQGEFLRRERDPPPIDADLVRRAVDHERADLQALLGGKLAPAPLERADASVELGRHARHHDEVVESAGRVEARDLPGRQRQDGGRLAQVGDLPRGPEGCGGQVGSLAGLEDHRPNVTPGPGLLDDGDKVIPSDRASELRSRVAAASQRPPRGRRPMLGGRRPTRMRQVWPLWSPLNTAHGASRRAFSQPACHPP